MSDTLKVGILAIEDPYYLEKNIVPMNDRGIFRSMRMAENEQPFLKPFVKNERFDKYVSFLFDYENVSGRIVYEKRDYEHLMSAFSVRFFPKEDSYSDEELYRACRLISQKLQAHIQVKVSPKKQDFTFHKLFEHAAKSAEESVQKYIDGHFDFWLACAENEAAEENAVFGNGEERFED